MLITEHGEQLSCSVFKSKAKLEFFHIAQTYAHNFMCVSVCGGPRCFVISARKMHTIDSDSANVQVDI